MSTARQLTWPAAAREFARATPPWLARLLTLLPTLALLSSCNEVPRAHPPSRESITAPTVAHKRLPAPVRNAYGSVDEYKTLVAQQIVRLNPAFVFNGTLPPMLPAIVVVDIGIDKDGAVHRVSVHRSRDDQASQIALAAVRRSGPFAMPHNLAPDARRPLVFSETFLFNRDYKFQLRTLADVQPGV
ncbi:MAG: hypothetical protein V4582_01655 [Pseudomonadota bacterium]